MDRRPLTVLQILPALESGGVERGTLEVARALVDRGHRSLVMSTGGRLVPQLEQEGSTHITAPVSKSHHLRALGFAWPLRAVLETEQIDVVHARSRHPAWVAWLACRALSPRHRPSFVTTAHGLYSVNWYSAIMARGERVIAISDTVREYLLRNYPQFVSADRIPVIHRGIDPASYFPEFRPSADWLARWNSEFPQLTGKQLITLPGRLTRLKGHTDLLTIMEQLRPQRPDVHAVIVGGIDPRRRQYAEELQREIAQRGLTDCVTLTGHRSDLREILSISRVALSLTNHPPEAFGRTTVEALSLGTPVVGYGHGGTGEVLAALFPEGAVPSGNVTAAAARVSELLGTPSPAIRPNDLFLESRMIEQTLEVYHELTEQPRLLRAA